MSPKEFFDAVCRMREAQITYEKVSNAGSWSTENAKHHAETCEKVVDDEIARVNLLLNDKVKKMKEQFDIIGIERHKD